jgi:tetrahydromethanopterin S-methyltransferase subunit G
MEEKFDYFIHRTEEDMKEIKCRLDKLNGSVDTLLQFKWQIIGGAAAISVVTSVLVGLLGILIRG